MQFHWLGEQPYLPLLASMQQHARALQSGDRSETLWCCWHQPVYTTGQRAADNRRYATLPAPLVVTDRGGETTFHGPGQLMLYPILSIRARALTVRHYIALLEESCIALLAQEGISSERVEGAPGVWSEQGKIASIGVRISRGVAWHGMALNVTTDLDWFREINPCGLSAAPDRMSSYIDPPPLEQLADNWHRHLRTLLRQAEREQPGEAPPSAH
ncbi:MAG: lipoyl(octanoyl) transferase LipB [Mariprofundales bacterium]|nr:lipoyl(octanoyl) transferase LipB [Mariprofundales bacterium]